MTKRQDPLVFVGSASYETTLKKGDVKPGDRIGLSFGALLAELPMPVLAFCRSGTRSIVTWSIGQAQAGERPRDELVALGAQAGYDLSGVLGV